MKAQRGFTLIELVVVIVVLGILAAVAVPKFLDMTIEGHNAAAKGVAGSIASGTSINMGARLAGTLGNIQVIAANVCTNVILQPFVSGVTLTAVAPVSDDQFLVGAVAGQPTTCAVAATSVTCQITPRGAGVTAAQTIVMCAR